MLLDFFVIPAINAFGFNKGISTMVNGIVLNFGKGYKDDLRVIFDQYPKLQLGLGVLSIQKILKGI